MDLVDEISSAGALCCSLWVFLAKSRPTPATLRLRVLRVHKITTFSSSRALAFDIPPFPPSLLLPSPKIAATRAASFRLREVMYTPATTHHSLAFAISEVHCKVHCETGIFRSKSDACDLLYLPPSTHTHRRGRGQRRNRRGHQSVPRWL